MPSIDFASLNYLAIAIAAIGTFFIGGGWYTVLFGSAYQKAARLSDEQMKTLHTERPPAVFFGSLIVCYFLIAFGIALLQQVAGISGAGVAAGALFGVLLALVVSAVTWTIHIASNRDHTAYGIDFGYQLIYLIGVNTLLGAWA